MATSEADRPPITHVDRRAAAFALIDHGLTGPNGHNLTYCRRILTAAAMQGMRVIAGVGRTGGSCDTYAPSLALFPRDVWKNNPAEGRLWNVNAALRSLGRLRRRETRSSAAPVTGLQSGEQEAGGHGLALGLLTAMARGFIEDASAIFAVHRNARLFSQELASFISQAELQPGDVIYLPTVLAAELRGVETLVSHSPAARRFRWRLMLRYAPRAASVRSGIAGSCRRLTGRGDLDISFFSDTEQLCHMYEALCDTPFTLLPIPVDPEIMAPEGSSGTLVIGYFGDARDEKGFDLLPSVIRHVRERARGGPTIRFVVQTNLNTPAGDAKTRAARLELISLGGGDLDLFEGPLSLDAYQSLVRGANIVILPYEPSAYAERSSGILMEALTAGAPCVVTSGGWMASMIEAAGASSPAGVVVAADARAIADGVLHVAANWPRYSQGARSLRQKLSPRFDPAELVRLVIDGR